jgi:trans-aconitate methyltransferase
MKHMEKFEQLVDEMVKVRADSERIRHLMTAAGLQYTEDHVECLRRVLSALEDTRSSFSKIPKSSPPAAFKRKNHEPHL